MDLQSVTNDTLNRVQLSIAAGLRDGSIFKVQPGSLGGADSPSLTFGGTPGPVGINLEPQSKMLTPLMAPWRQNIARRVDAGGNSSLWKAVTKYAMGSNPFVAVGNPGNVPTSAFVDKQAAFKVLSVRDGVTREDMAAGVGFEDVQARLTTRALMKSLMLEELAFLGAIITDIGAVTGLTVATAAGVSDTTGGGIAFTAAAGFVNVAPVTMIGLEYLRSLATPVSVSYPKDYTTDALLSVAAVGPIIGRVSATDATGVVGTVTLADCGIGKFVAANVADASPASTAGLRITWNPVNGAVAYIVFYGLTNNLTTGIGAQCVVAQTTVTLTCKNSTVGSDIATVTTDQSGSSIAYDGIIPQLTASGSGAYIKNVAGKLTSSGGEIVELQEAFANIFANAKLGEFWIIVGGVEQRTITKLGVGAGGGPTIYVDPNDAARAMLTQGYRVGSIYNGTTGDVCSVVSAPWIPGGTILVIPKTIPYPDANQGAPFDWVGGYDWTRFDYPMTVVNGLARSYPFEVTCWGVLRGVYTGGCGILQGIYKA